MGLTLDVVMSDVFGVKGSVRSGDVTSLFLNDCILVINEDSQPIKSLSLM